MRRCHPFLCCFLILILILIVGCTQTGTVQPPSAGPSPPVPLSPAPEISPVTTAVQAVPAVSPAATTPATLLRGTADPAFVVDFNESDRISPGTTLLVDNHNAARPRIVEVNRLGEVVWEYLLPDSLKAYTNPGWDVEMLPNGNILTLLPGNGVYELSRDKKVVWKYLDPKVSHDADRLPDGNTLIAFGNGDTATDTQVKEIDSKGNVFWSWHARDAFNGPEYAGISEEGWTHTNAVTRLASGNTLVSLRNFNLIAEIDPAGKLVRTIGKGILTAQHDPLVLTNGNILLANHGIPNAALELDPTGQVVWHYVVNDRRSWPVRDVNRLANGNTLITEADRIIEVTPDGQLVWQFRLATPLPDTLSDPQNNPASRGFYKAERIPA